MAKHLLPRLSSRNLHVSISRPGFEQLTADSFGNDFGPSDGFDADFSSVVSALGADTGVVADLDKHLGDAAFTPGQIAPALYGQAARDTNDFIAAGDSSIDFLAATAVSPPSGAPDCTPTLANPLPCGIVNFGGGENEI